MVFDVSDPESVTQVGSCAVPYYGYDISVDGDHAYVAASITGLLIIDISDPLNPQMTAQMALDGYATGIHAVGQMAYVSSYDSMLFAVDISDPVNPVEAGFHSTPGRALDVYYSYPYIYVVCDTVGLLIYEYTGTGCEDRTSGAIFSQSAYRLVRNPVTSGYIELAARFHEIPTACDFSLYDASGSLVRDYDQAIGGTRDRNVRLPVTDLPGGVYFLVIKNGRIASQEFKIIKTR